MFPAVKRRPDRQVGHVIVKAVRSDSLGVTSAFFFLGELVSRHCVTGITLRTLCIMTVSSPNAAMDLPISRAYVYSGIFSLGGRSAFLNPGIP